eukprot:2824858-Ditylum_brightwellii.AAC.1
MAHSSSAQISITAFPSPIMASKKNLMILTGTLLALVGKPEGFLDLTSMIFKALLSPQIDGVSNKFRWNKYIQSDVVWVWFW